MSASFSLGVSENWRLAISAGGILDGELSAAQGDFTLQPGWMLGIAGTWSGVKEDGATPYVDLNVGLTATRAALDVTGNAVTTIDIRLAVIVGWTVADVWRPYLSARLFNGPVLWTRPNEDLRMGSDRFFTQAAVGMSFLLPNGVTIFGEYADLMERKITAGLAASF